MKKLLVLTFMFLNTVLFSLDRSLDVSLTTDFSNFKQRSHIDLVSQAVVPFTNRAFLLSPQASMFFDGSMDMSIAAGLRHQTPFGTLGHHLFWSVTMSKTACLHQAGHSLDLLTPNFDFRINYYHPMAEPQLRSDCILVPQKWMEGEVLYKHSSFLIGAGPRYNIMDKTWGFQSKFIVPFEWISVGSFINYDSDRQFAGGFCLSFRLFGLPTRSSDDSPIIHSRMVRFSKQPKPAPKIEKKIPEVEKPAEAIQPIKEEKVVVEEEPKPVSPALQVNVKEADHPEEEKPVSFNFFLGNRRKTN